jgi:DNA-binding response OmpR family regulator
LIPWKLAARHSFYWFSSRGYKVLEAATGQEAIEACGRFDGLIDLMLCDVTLPDVSGQKLALELVKSHPETSILFVSGIPQDGWSNAELHDFRQLPPGSADSLEKPFRPAALEAKVEDLLTPCRHGIAAPRAAFQFGFAVRSAHESLGKKEGGCSLWTAHIACCFGVSLTAARSEWPISLKANGHWTTWWMPA